MLAPMSRSVIEATGVAMPPVSQHAAPVRPLLVGHKQRQYINRLKARLERHQSHPPQDVVGHALPVPPSADAMGLRGYANHMPWLR